MDYLADRKKWLAIVTTELRPWTEEWRVAFAPDRQIHQYRRGAHQTHTQPGLVLYTAGLIVVTPLVSRLLNTPYTAEVEAWTPRKKPRKPRKTSKKRPL